MPKAILILPVLLLSGSLVWGQAATIGPDAWNGQWTADGTFFAVAVTVEDNVFTVQEAQSLGFQWTAQTGLVNGDQASIEVTYAGATAMILIRLTDENTAVAEAANCRPEFMVVCTLAKGQQAVFVKSSEADSL